jgi:hypothetical protein
MKKYYLGYGLLMLQIFIISCSKSDDKSILENNVLEVPTPTNINIEETGKIILGAPTDKSIKINLLFDKDVYCIVDYSEVATQFSSSTNEVLLYAGTPNTISIENLSPQKRYYYRLRYKEVSAVNYTLTKIYTFTTQRFPGSTFSFGIQGDSHPEREGIMFNSGLYDLNMKNVSLKGVDFYFALGDDFSIERLIEFNNVSQQTVDAVYQLQRKYLGQVGSNASVFLVNGNHEQAAKYLLDGSPNNPAVIAANSRKKYYPAPLPNSFYTGDTKAIDYIGLLGDYYAFTWGNALFVVIDPYWHSSVAVDNTAYGTVATTKNLWDVTLGDEQYNWLKTTLEKSTAKYKFVFSHHVLGTGRGGIEVANLCEWGGYNQKGVWEFDKYRPGWDKPIHQLMVSNNVTIFFQGHDHIFCKQVLDGVIYQSVPNPADDTYSAFNSSSYKSGIIYPNSGFLNVTVAPEKVQVDYIAASLSGALVSNGKVIHSYTVSK